MTEKRQMTDREKYAATRLVSCTFLPGSYNKRFAMDIYWMAKSGIEATEKQIANLWRLVYRYRRQIKDTELVAEAQEKGDSNGK